MKRSAILLWVLGPLLLLLSLYRPFPASRPRASALPARVGSFTLAMDHELSARTRELLGTNDAAWRTYRDAAGHEIYVVAVFHEQNWKSVHPPRICIEGSNMTITHESERELAPGAAARCAVLEAKSNENGRQYLSCSLYGTVDFSTPSYSTFFMHHAPSALLRRTTSGFLLRVEAWGSASSTDDLTRLVDFLSALLPMAREVLR